MRILAEREASDTAFAQAVGLHLAVPMTSAEQCTKFYVGLCSSLLHTYFGLEGLLACLVGNHMTEPPKWGFDVDD